MEHTSGIPLDLTGNNIWHGTNLSNGKMMLLHTFNLTTAWSKLIITTALQAELTTAGTDGVPFGNAAWYDRYLIASAQGTLYAGVPTAANAVPKLAGVIAYEAGLASGQPANNGSVMTWSKGKLIKRGFVAYKKAKAGAAGAIIHYADVNDATMVMFVENSTGDPVVAVPTSYTNGVPVLANCTYLGKIVLLEPENEQWVVELGF